MKKFKIFIICVIVLLLSKKIYNVYKEAERDKQIEEWYNSEEYKAKLAAEKAAEEEEDRQFRASLSNKYPYEGLLEKHIDYTALGPADECDRSHFSYKLRPDRRSTMYRWYTSTGKLKAVATISYWDYEADRQVPGYVTRFNTYFEEGE